MKIIIKPLLAVFLLTAISCVKENSTIQSSGMANESSTQNLLSEMDAVAKITSVKIGTQRWMTKNLGVTRYRNGDKIPQIKDSAKWVALTTGAWCWYNNDSATGAIYG